MSWCVRHLLGANAEKILAATDAAVLRQTAGPERLDIIRKTFDYLREQRIELAPATPFLQL